MDERSAVFRITGETNDGSLSAANGWAGQQSNRLARQALTELAANLEQRREVLDEAARKRVLDDGGGDRPSNRDACLAEKVRLYRLPQEHGFLTFTAVPPVRLEHMMTAA